MRGEEHLTDLEKRVAEKPLWKHIQEKHQALLSGAIVLIGMKYEL